MTSIPNNNSIPTDEVLVKLAKNGVIKAEQSILERYRESVRITAAAYTSNFAVSCSLSSIDHDDLVQEGMSGLLSAIYSFREDKNVSFRTYASKCIANAIRTALRSSTRKKNTPPGGVVSLSDIDIMANDSLEDSIISAESTDSIFRFLSSSLSDKESDVARLYISGKKYKDIAEELGLTEKAVDNALQRIRTKLTRFLDENRS